MNRIGRVIAVALGLFGAQQAGAYDSQVHAYMTYQAYLISGLGNSPTPAVLQRLGLDRLDAPQPFSPYWVSLPLPLSGYYDNATTDTNVLEYVRAPAATEWWQMQQLAAAKVFGANASSFVGPSAVQTLPIVNWLMRGAIREDDLIQSDYRPGDGPLPDLDPRGEFRRVLNHFYDPINNRMLHAARYGLPDTDCSFYPAGYPTYAGAYCGKSIDWGLGTTDAFASLVPAATHANHFSWEDARQNEFLALTAERDANSNSVREASERQADAQERLLRWATTFRSVGNVVHLLEDLAQPQHSRVDAHDPHVDPSERQAFEPFTTARLIGIPQTGQQPVPPIPGETYVYNLTGAQVANYMTPLPGVSGYPEPSFATALRFFTTRAAGDTASTPPTNRLGMADYTNRGFFTRGTLPGTTNFPAPPAPVADGTNGYTAMNTPCEDLPAISSKAVTCKVYVHTVPDPFQPTRADVTTPEPMVADGMWAGLIGSTKQFTLSPAIFQVQGNLSIPRAIAYSAGLIDYFFRGQLAVTAPPDKIVGVLNQGAQHTMNAQGYPCVGTATNDGCPIFGFQSIRVSVQNMTAPITESGTTSPQIAQNLSATAVGSTTDPNFHGPYLVAVAKYHRNTCYKPDLSGEPYQIYNYTPPSTGITQPACGGQTTRTAYQEISVSKSFAATAAQLVANAPAFEVHFDFSADPIPVNATDLFIQVVYRGPMGDSNGQEPDAIAVGTLDVREPTFAAFWNNTDYFWNSGATPPWLHENSLNHNEGIESFWSCMGGAPVKKVFEYDGAVGSPAMADPIVSSGNPGMVRLAAIFPPPDPGLPLQQKNIRAVPVHYAGDQLIVQESVPTRGVFRQANLENIDVSTLIPYSGCATNLPTDTKYWCFDPIQRRRSQLFGSPFSPLYIDLSFDTASDVDSVPLPVFSGTVPLAAGTNLFDTNATLPTCTTQPAAPTTPNDQAYQAYLRYLDVLEEARDLGVSGEMEVPLQREVPEQQ